MNQNRFIGYTVKYMFVVYLFRIIDIGTVGAKSDQQVNICSFVVRCDRMWPSTQCHRIYTSSGNVPYVQFQSVCDFIPESRCSKFVVGLQTSRNKNGVLKARSDSEPKGRE